MYDKLTFEIEGVVPTILHNGQMADPLNRYSKALKAISAKKKKTDQDHEDMARIEWEGGFYFNDQMQPCWPGENIERVLVDAAKKDREGPGAKSGIMVDGNFPILYDGPTNVDELWASGNYKIAAKVKVGMASIIRTRPIFRVWAMKVDVSYLADVVNPAQVERYMRVAGQLIGLSDWRPKYGRFVIKSVK